MLDLYERENEEALMRTPGTRNPEAGVFDGFFRGAGNAAVRTAIKTIARPVAMIGSIGAGMYDSNTTPGGYYAISDGTSARDRYFKSMDEIFDSALDYWTPKAGEVGVAGEVVGQLLGLLPIVVASPAAAVAGTYLDTATELSKKGVSDGRAQAVGAAQAVGLGAGIWMPILGQTLAQRVLLGGAGFNVLQGVATRGAGELILGDHPAAAEFKALDGHALTLDVLLGMAFGGITHLSPAQRAQGAAAWSRIKDWANELPPSDKSAIMVLREGQHLNLDSLPGKPVAAVDQDAHVQLMRTVLDQVIRGEPPHVEGMPAPKMEPDPARWTQAEKRAEYLRAQGVRVAEFYDFVIVDPAGGSPGDHLRLTSEQIGDVLIKRGDAWREGLEIQHGDYGLVKIIFKHGERSSKVAEVQVKKADVERLPEVLDDWVPIRDHTRADGKRIVEWQIPRDDGKNVMYVLNSFIDEGNAMNLLTMFVNEGTSAKFKRKPISEKRGPDSPGGGSKPRSAAAGTGDTGPGTFSLDLPDGQDGKSIAQRTEGPPAQRAEPASPPPPEAGTKAEPAGPEAVDPLARMADSFVTERPDLPIRVGTATDGTPSTVSARQFLDNARQDAQAAKKDAALFEVAAACLMGN